MKFNVQRKILLLMINDLTAAESCEWNDALIEKLNQ